MIVRIRNKSNKNRSLEAMKELKELATFVAQELNITEHINSISINYTKELNYYLKNKPLYGFYKLFNDNKVRIDLAKNWDKSQIIRKTTIVHELVHVKQMIEKRLVIGPDLDTAHWNGKLITSWKKFRWKELKELKTTIEQSLYIKKTLPWESEVNNYVKKYINE